MVHNVVDLGLVEASIDSSEEMLLEFEKIEYQYELRFVLTKLRENASLLWDTLQWRDNKMTREKSKMGWYGVQTKM